jgi:hypothetical protein
VEKPQKSCLLPSEADFSRIHRATLPDRVKGYRVRGG